VKRYPTVVADPPWPSMHQRSTYHRGKPERHYSTMTVDAIAAINVDALAADSAHLWLWGVNRLMEDAYRVVRAWGFTPMGLVTWAKHGPGMGYYLRTNTEQCILATRGEPMVPSDPYIASWFEATEPHAGVLREWPRGHHSEKPDAFYDLVEQVSPTPRVELFARRARFGWDYWGDQSLGTAEMAA
jgi:N6-adenosine-specific RNA methylase IME4